MGLEIQFLGGPLYNFQRRTILSLVVITYKMSETGVAEAGWGLTSHFFL